MTQHSTPNKSHADDDINVDSEVDFDFDNEPVKLTGNDHEKQVRQRIYDLLEKKRLKALLDDTDDWDI